MPQLEHIEAIEKRLWKAADTLRANSNYASNEYFLPVMGLVFLRHAYSRFLAVKESIESSLPKGDGKTRSLTKEDFSQKGAIFLKPEAQFDYLVSLPDSEVRAKAIIEAMESIEADYENLRGVLPKSEYQELDNQVLGSSAGGGESKVRQKLVETGAVDLMIAIRSNFFYTRTVPCELWFLNRNKPEEHREKVLMIDARNIYRKVTRKIYDFSPEQERNLLAIVWLYRGQTDRYLDLVSSYCRRTLEEAAACFSDEDENGNPIQPLPEFVSAIEVITDALEPVQKKLSEDASQVQVQKELTDSVAAFQADVEAFHQALAAQQEAWKTQKTNNGELKQAVELLVPLAETSLNLVKQIDLLYKLASHMNETGEDECNSRSRNGADREITRALKAVDETRQRVVLKLKQVRYSWRQGRWLTERFPDAKLRDVEGLVKLVTIDMIAHNDWSLTPGRYVGVAPEEVDENFDFEEALHEIHVELEDLNAEAVQLAATIKKNFEELGA